MLKTSQNFYIKATKSNKQKLTPQLPTDYWPLIKLS